MKPPDRPRTGFTVVEHGAADIILAAAFNHSGTRITLCSADHKIRVYDLEEEKKWSLVDQWRGHDAEVLDAQWVGPTLGQLFATIGGDNKFKLWREDPSQAPRGGRRFKCIFSQSPGNHVSYVSFDMKTVKTEVWVALLTQDGCLSLLEPSEPESLSSWKEVDSIWPFGKHARGSEPRSKLSFHQSERPCYDAIVAGLDPRALSIAASATNIVKIFRALKSEDASYQFHQMLEIKIDASVINDIAWAPGCIRPYDLIAAACDDGSVRIIEITTPHDGMATFIDGSAYQSGTNRSRAPSSTYRNAPSGITAGLAGVLRATARNTDGPSRIRHESKQVANLPHAEHTPVWKVRWTHDGNAVASTGDSGKAHLWKRDLSGNFIEFAETGPS